MVGRLWAEEEGLGGIRSYDRFLGRVTLLGSWSHVFGGHVLSSGKCSSSHLQTRKLKVGLVRLCIIPYFKYPVGIDHRYSPRPGEEPKDKVCLHSEPSLIKKLKDELEKTTTDLCNCIVLGIRVLTTAHSTVIGCSGCNLINFQNKFNVQMQYPGSNSYKNAGPVNFFQLA